MSIQKAKQALAPTLLLACCAVAHAQTQPSMEERLRTELRHVTTQLQQARSELEMLKAKAEAKTGAKTGAKAVPVAAAAPASEGLKKELARSQALLAQERAQREQLLQQQQRSTAAAQESAANLAQYRQASDKLVATGKQLEAERARLDGELTAQRATLARCESQNAQLYATGKEILQAYEALDVVDVVRARQPFAAQSRVKLEQVAQQYGDQLYQGRFDARATPAPAAAPQ